MRHRLLVIGGRGVFGRRLVEGLLETTDAVVIIGGRKIGPDDSFVRSCRERYGSDRVEVAIIDRNAAYEGLRRLDPFCVVDAAGPFQNSEPHLARAAIAARCRYVDLADARDFVSAFGALDGAARQAGVLAVTGASSTPALSGAAVAALTAGWQQVDEIEIAIAPGNRAPRGLSVVQAILAYAGRPVKIWIDGLWKTRSGWGELVEMEMPGLGRRWLSICETPDLDLLPARYPSARTVPFRAGLELSILHLGLWLLSLPVRWHMVSSLRPLAPFLQRIASRFESFGTDRGGMIVEAQGRSEDGRAVAARWSLVAEVGDGPHIPVLPALALIRHWLADDRSPAGAAVASDLLTLDMIENEFRRFRIRTEQAESRPDATDFLEKIRGRDAERLPAIVRQVHAPGPRHLSGRVSVKAPRRLAARILACVFGFPGTISDQSAAVVLENRGRTEIWTRRFGKTRFRSMLWSDGRPRRLYEKFGPFAFELGIEPHLEGFSLTVIGWRLGFLRLPSCLMPRAPARTFVDQQGRYRFDVSITLPVIGLLVHYSGWLMPQDT